MKKKNEQRRRSLLLATIATVLMLAASDESLAQKGIGAKFGARDPRTCADKTLPKTGAPTSAQVAQYVACSAESAGDYLYLVENVTVQVGKPRPYNVREDINFPDIDTAFPVYPIRGSLKKYQCSPIYLDRSNSNRNCRMYDEPNAKGACYKNSFGDWRCSMTDASTSALVAQEAPPPGATRAPKDAPQKTTTAANEQPQANDRTVDKAAADKTENGYPKPDFSAMEEWFEIVRYEYPKPPEKYIYVYLKPKTERTPTEFRMEFRDRDGILLQDKEVSMFNQMPGYGDAAVGETVKVRVFTLSENALKQATTAKVVRVQ